MDTKRDSLLINLLIGVSTGFVVLCVMWVLSDALVVIFEWMGLLDVEPTKRMTRVKGLAFISLATGVLAAMRIFNKLDTIFSNKGYIISGAGFIVGGIIGLPLGLLSGVFLGSVVEGILKGAPARPLF